jgi:hypothetical protein
MNHLFPSCRLMRLGRAAQASAGHPLLRWHTCTGLKTSPWRYAIVSHGTLQFIHERQQACCLLYFGREVILLHILRQDAFAKLRSVRPCSPKLAAIRAATADILYGGPPVPVRIAVHRPGLAQRIQVPLACLRQHHRNRPCADHRQSYRPRRAHPVAVLHHPHDCMQQASITDTICNALRL